MKAMLKCLQALLREVRHFPKKLNVDRCQENVLKQFSICIEQNDDYDYSAEKRKLRDELFIGEKVYVLAEQIKKKSAPGKFYKQSVQNIGYFNKEKIRAIQSIGGIKYY